MLINQLKTTEFNILLWHNYASVHMDGFNYVVHSRSHTHIIVQNYVHSNVQSLYVQLVHSICTLYVQLSHSKVQSNSTVIVLCTVHKS